MMSVLNQSGEEQVECPLCMEPLEVDDLNFFPCTCGYQICRFCWHRIRTDENGLCPACRKAYPENPADFKPLTQEEVAKLKAEKRHKDQQRKQKITENRKHLANVRVVQRNLVFVVGLPMRLADSEVLKKHEYFGKFGKIHKVVINQSTSYAGSQISVFHQQQLLQGPSASAYVTYQKADDALRAIQAVNNIVVDGRTVKTSLGTTKYCSHFMKNQTCPKPDCMYLHDLGDIEASFTKEEMQQGKHQEYERKLHEQLLNSYNQGNKDRKPTPSPPAVALNSMNCMPIGSSSSCCVSSSNPHAVQGTQSCNKEAWPSLQPGVPSPGTNCTGSSTSMSSISSNSSSNSSSSSSNNGTSSGSNLSCSVLSGSSGSHHGNPKGERRQKFDHSNFNIISKGNQGHKKRHGVEDHRGKGKDKHHNSLQDDHINKNAHSKSMRDGNARVNNKSKEVHDVSKGVSRCQNQINCDMNVVSGETQGVNVRVDCNLRDIETEVKMAGGGETHESSVQKAGSAGGRPLPSHRAATLFEPDNNSFFSSNSFTKVSASAAGSAGSDWPLSSLTLTHMPDVLPPVHSSEDWQAAFGFSNSVAAVPLNQVDSPNHHVVSETPSSGSEYANGKDSDNCDQVGFESQNGQAMSVQGFNCHSSHSSSSENISSNTVLNSPEEYRLTEVGHLNQKLNELMLEDDVGNSVISDDSADPTAGCEMSADVITMHSTANCENPNVIPCNQSHLYPNMPSPAFVQDPTVFMVNRHPFMQSANHVLSNGIQPVQAAKFLSEFHLRQQGQVQNSQTLPVHLRNHPGMEGTTYSRHIIDSGVNSKFVLNTNTFGGTGDGNSLLSISKIGREVPKLPNTTNSESKENSGVSDNAEYSNYDTLEGQNSCENSSDEFVEYNGDSENSAHESNEEITSKESQRATDDDLGFDPFHETQKALAEMMEKENMMLMLQGQQNNVPHPNSHISHLNQLHQQYHQINHMNHHPAQFTQATMFGGTKILPSCHAPLQPHLLQNNHRLQTNVAAVGACSKMDGLVLGPGPGSVPPRARLPPPGFTTAPNHMNAFGLGIPRAPTNTGSKILPFMGLGNGTSSTNTGTSSPLPQNLNSLSTNINISSALSAQQNVSNVNPSPLLFHHPNNHSNTATHLNSTFSAQNGIVAHNSAVPKSASDSFNAKEWSDNLRSLLPNINTGSGVSQSPVPVAFSGSNTPTPPSPPPPPSNSQNSSYAVPPHASAQTNPVKTWTGAGPCSDWTALDPAIMSSRPHSGFSSNSATPQHPIILCNSNSVLNQQSPNTQYLHLQNTTHWLRSLASDGCLLYGANISQNMSNSDWTVQSHHSNSIAPPPPGFSLRMTAQQTTIQNKLAVSASQEITKIENI